MALKFLNKKGWHTGSLRNIENVWKAEQKRDAEDKKLEELRKQIQEERERHEFRLLQEQAGLVPKQERLDFLYDSGLSVGKGSSSDGGGFKALEAKTADTGKAGEGAAAASSLAPASATPGALFEDKPQSANDAWRKLHSDPLLMIRQREQEALARIKNNPVQMAMIRKSVEEKAPKKKDHDKKESRKKHHHSSSKYQKRSSSRQQSDSEDVTAEGEKRKTHRHKNLNYDEHSSSEDESSKMESQRRKDRYKSSKYREQSPTGMSSRNTAKNNGQDRLKGNHSMSERVTFSSKGRADHDVVEKERESRTVREASRYHGQESHSKRRNVASKLSEEERAARLREMQVDAELHEEQRWKRLKKAAEDDAQEATQDSKTRGKNFLDATQRSVYGAEKGGSLTIEESVRRRTHYSQGRSEAREGNAFRR
ncbi:pre-mRNA-splicing factor CWC25 homolog [Quercus lobata]|uniref:CBF1-interacting co-repressor CIR N-terminal domain-containing protein n=1 Tax=Quercus lobata TaxID=97700 RepID=A0A7N2LSV5_QUELO|nr:pre-mRNA-splicing factor CWC25 homolog [Quercus lobata]